MYNTGWFFGRGTPLVRACWGPKNKRPLYLPHCIGMVPTYHDPPATYWPGIEGIQLQDTQQHCKKTERVALIANQKKKRDCKQSEKFLGCAAPIRS